MEWKPGDLSKPFWRTFNLHEIPEHFELQQTMQWRRHYDVSPISSSTSTTSLSPVLPHSEHSNVHFEQPVFVVPGHAYILQSCWGRSAQHHSQGPATSLYWPPWRSTPPSSPAGQPCRTTTQPLTSAPFVYTQEQAQLDQNGVTDMSESSV